MWAKEFLGRRNVSFKSFNAMDPEGLAYWESIGRPPLPALVVDGRVSSLYHPTQIASALDLPVDPSLESSRAAWDLTQLMEAWLAHLRVINWDLMIKPTPSRGRTIRHLTVNVHLPITLLAEAWDNGRFEWHTTGGDDEIAATLQTEDEVRHYALAAAARWMKLLAQHGDHLQESDPIIATPRGNMRFSELLAYLRVHSAFHYRQIVAFLATENVVLTNAFNVEVLRDLELPASVF